MRAGREAANRAERPFTVFDGFTKACDMKMTLPVKDRAERQAIARAFAEPELRAFMVSMGILLELPTDRSRERVLRWVVDKFDEDRGMTDGTD